MAHPRKTPAELTDAAATIAGRFGSLGGGFGRILAAFAAAAGTDLARVATPTSLRNGTLTIRCSSASWAQTIGLMEAQLLERLAAELGGHAVTRIHARAGGREPAAIVDEDAPPPTLAPLPPVDAATEQQLAELVASIADDKLRAQVLAAARAGARRRAANAAASEAADTAP